MSWSWRRAFRTSSVCVLVSDEEVPNAVIHRAAGLQIPVLFGVGTLWEVDNVYIFFAHTSLSHRSQL
ncbi:hypothetical protein CY34DRAFT_813902 [Suillus luteus UH-Slu-Lm8-n1]|uniref:Unplaced genomic scaffold CY34scaffold_918, whole genome shotgun sequence n=1 Tax=Suillus luteus UH-Slu-Lm8-n1 TaxID=930992 RepID=A0A0D0AFP5_9AGAM|nr:hypothetical protein CY34DRAFT_813902 [Suillus luteus UH-Slu-Lm8-n1]